MTSCSTVIPSQQPLNALQRVALQLVAVGKGRDVVLAIDLTESVGLNDEGRLRLRQIVEGNLRRGDTVHIIPFATDIKFSKSIAFQGKAEEIEQIVNAIPLQADLTLKNTDIQQAELFIYQYLAQQNQCRLFQDQPLKSQSVVWITDAPLFTRSGSDWIETPADSPFRQENSPASRERWEWMNVLPLQARSLVIIDNRDEPYRLSVVDISPTVQEFCTPAPGGEETCLVNSYLFKQLSLPGAGLMIGLVFTLLFILRWKSWRIHWKLIVETEEDLVDDEKIYYLKHNQRLTLGGEAGINTIGALGSETRGYLERKYNQLYLVPLGDSGLEWRGKPVKERTKITSSFLTLTYFQRERSFEIRIRVQK